VVKPRVVILRVAGTNCDLETEWAMRMAGAIVERVHLNQFLSGKKKLKDYQALIIPGGFSYGDDIAAGKVLANQLIYRLRNELYQFIEKKKPVLGICNGFQVLVKTGLLPGFASHQQVTLTWNDSGHFECRWVHLKVEASICPFTHNLPEIIQLPVAHAEGKFLPENKKVMQTLQKGKQVVFRYVTPSGEKATYPYNPNGSVEGVAGICSSNGLLLGMMPHPERCTLVQHFPDWLRYSPERPQPFGFLILQNVVKFISQ